MQGNNAARVGLTVLAAAGLLAYATFSLKGTVKGGTHLEKVSFEDAQGIQEGGDVRVRGVSLGAVDAVDLDPARGAVLTLRMRNTYHLQPSDSVRIVGGLLSLNPPFVEITPGARKGVAVIEPGQPIPGETTTGPDRLLSQSDQLLSNLNDLTKKMTVLADNLSQVAGDPNLKRNLTAMTSNFATISRSGVVIAKNMEGATARSERLIAGFQATTGQLSTTLKQASALLTSLQKTAGGGQELMADTRALMRETRTVVEESRGLVRNTNDVVQKSTGLVTDLRGILGENREKFAQVFENLNGSLEQLQGVLADARQLTSDPELRADFKSTITHLRDATENLKAITADVHNVTGDPKVQEDLKSTVGSLKTVTGEASAVLKRASAVLGTSGSAAKTLGQKLGDSVVNADLVRTIETGRTRLDLDASIPWTKDSFYRVGFRDFGESNRFIAQAGQQIRPGVAGRFGFYASKLGLGLDFGNWRRPPFQLELYGIDKPRADVRATIPFTSTLGLSLGFENLLNDADPFIGLRYRK